MGIGDLGPGIRGLGGGSSPAQGLLARQGSFAEAMGIAERRIGGGVADREARAREAAEQLVATAFVRPVLASLRGSEGAAEPFAPTTAEKQFGAIQDQRLADELVRAARFPLVDRLARDLLRSGGGATAARAAAHMTPGVVGSDAG